MQFNSTQFYYFFLHLKDFTHHQTETNQNITISFNLLLNHGISSQWQNVRIYTRINKESTIVWQRKYIDRNWGHVQSVVEIVTVLPLESHWQNLEYASTSAFGRIETLFHISIPLPLMLHILISWQQMQERKKDSVIVLCTRVSTDSTQKLSALWFSHNYKEFSKNWRSWEKKTRQNYTISYCHAEPAQFLDSGFGTNTLHSGPALKDKTHPGALQTKWPLMSTVNSIPGSAILTREKNCAKQ